MYFEVRVIYKDGTCAVFDNCRLCAVGKYTAIVPCNLEKKIIKIDSDKYEHIKAIKVVIKKGYKFYETK